MPKEDVEDQTNLFHEEGLLAVLQALPPDGFERICQRVIGEAGFQRSKGNGRSIVARWYLMGYGILGSKSVIVV